MKKQIYTYIIMLLFSSSPMFAQRLVQFGAHAGVNVSNADKKDNYQDSQTRAGYTFGVYARIGHKLFVQPQIDYLGISTNLTRQSAQGQTVKESLDYGMLNIPVLAGYKIFQSYDEKSNFRIMAGGVYSTVLNVQNSSANYNKDSFNDSIFSVGGGLGFDIKFIKIDLLGQYGLNDFYKDPTGTRNRLVTLTVGFIL